MEPAAELHPDPILVVRKDLKAAASLLTPTEARYLVDLYYQIQDFRKTTANQIRQIGDSEPTFLIGWVFGNMETTEVEIKKALDVYTTHETTGMGKWAKGVMGIGPVISAGLLAHIDIAKCRTVGSIWRFAGLDPTSKWEKGKKRPWNARLKTLCWLMGQSFEKVSNKEDSLYGKLYKERKAKEWARNVAGEHRESAARILETKNIDKKTQAHLWLSGRVSQSEVQKILDEGDTEKLSTITATKKKDGLPMLPPGHIRQRACRWTVKVFLCHWFEEAYRRHHGKESPVIYSIAMLNHAHKIEPENTI